MTGTAEVIRGDARDMGFLDDDSVDLIVTSPPYWGLRSYRDAGEHYAGQVGSEDSPQQFVDELVGMIDSEWRRVLKPVGSLWLNLGDKYAGSGGHNNSSLAPARTGEFATRKHNAEAPRASRRNAPDSYSKESDGIRTKSLLGLPWRVALALIDRGWILRAEVIWDKPNGLPESVTDRVRRSHEQWFHFTLEPQYFSAVDEIREPAKTTPASDWESYSEGVITMGDSATTGKHRKDGDRLTHPLGRLPGSAWRIPSEPLLIPDGVREELGLVDHFAAFPQEWPRRLILGWSPSAICETCSEGLRPVVHTEQEQIGTKSGGRTNIDLLRPDGHSGGWDGEGYPVTRSLNTITGYECDCPELGATRPAVVLDPFGGTGTTAGVARTLGRYGISVDLSADYCRLAEWRIFESGHFSKTEQRAWAERQEQLL